MVVVTAAAPTCPARPTRPNLALFRMGGSGMERDVDLIHGQTIASLLPVIRKRASEHIYPTFTRHTKPVLTITTHVNGAIAG